jgi:hypothetical protein
MKKFDEVIGSYIKINREENRLSTRFIFNETNIAIDNAFDGIFLKVKGSRILDLDRKIEIIFRSMIQERKLKEFNRLKVTSRILKELE